MKRRRRSVALPVALKSTGAKRVQTVAQYTMPDGATSLTVRTKFPKPRLTPAQLKWTRKTRAKVRRDNPPSWVHDEPRWERAKAEVRPYWDNYSDPWAVVAHVYRNMGGS